MIPRPRTEAAARHNPGRWVCNARPEKCKGLFRVYGQDMECPLRCKCYWGRRNTYQWTPGAKTQGRYADLDVDAGWRDRHASRLAALLEAFCRETRREAARRYRENHREALAEKQAARRARQRPPPPEPKVRAVHPCGGDCDNCPLPEGPEACPYTDADDDALLAEERRERLRRQSREKHRREKAREAVDPAYRAHRAALGKERCRRYYEAHKDAILARARARRENKTKETTT